MRQGQRTDLEPSANLRKVSQEKAAKLLNVSERSLQDAKMIERESQRAMVAARLANMRQGGDRKSDQSPNSDHDISLARAGELLNVSRATVADAKLVERESPELEPIFAQEAKKRQLATLKRGDKKPVKENVPERKAQSRDQAAKVAGISGTKQKPRRVGAGSRAASRGQFPPAGDGSGCTRARGKARCPQAGLPW